MPLYHHPLTLTTNMEYNMIDPTPTITACKRAITQLRSEVEGWTGPKNTLDYVGKKTDLLTAEKLLGQLIYAEKQGTL